MSDKTEKTQADRARADRTTAADRKQADRVSDSEESVNGIKGQLVYPDRVVDAERAGLYAAGKVDTLDPDDSLDDRDVNLHRIQAPEEIESRDYDSMVNEAEDDDNKDDEDR
jgi:hypothetical protein